MTNLVVRRSCVRSCKADWKLCACFWIAARIQMLPTTPEIHRCSRRSSKTGVRLRRCWSGLERASISQFGPSAVSANDTPGFASVPLSRSMSQSPTPYIGLLGSRGQFEAHSLDELYLAHNTIPRVNTAIVTSNTLCPQRAKSPSISISGNNSMNQYGARIKSHAPLWAKVLRIVEFAIILIFHELLIYQAIMRSNEHFSSLGEKISQGSDSSPDRTIFVRCGRLLASIDFRNADQT